MATTQEYYRLRARQPRYATLLSTFANGMYVTNQLIPEGYAKYLINYDIDDTGSFIYPKKGKVVDTITGKGLTLASVAGHSEGWGSTHPQGAHVIGPVWLEDVTEDPQTGQDVDHPTTIGVVDIIWALGSPINFNAFHGLTDSYDYDGKTHYYYFDNYDYTEDENRMEPGQSGYNEDLVSRMDYKTGWIVGYNEKNGNFGTTHTLGMNAGRYTAREITGAWAFDKKFVDHVFRPVTTNYNNTIVLFAAQTPKLTYAEYRNPRYIYDHDAVYAKPKLTYYKIQQFYVQNSYPHEYRNYLLATSFETENIKVSTATTMGYNMLSNDPYTFQDTQSAKNIPLGIMAYAKDENGNYTIPVMNPTVGDTTRFRFYVQYKTNTEFDYDIDMLDLNAYNPDDKNSWVNLASVGLSSYNGAITLNWAPTTDKFLLRITTYTGNKGTTAGKASAYPYTSMFTCVTSGEKARRLEKYNLCTAKGMFNWANCVGLYGIEGAPEGVFFSDVGNPGYFPFPNNVMQFDGDVYAVYNYLNNLLVVTNKSFWLVTMGDSIQTSTQIKVLDNLDITEIDAINIVILKDEIFFKSGNAFYVLKPNKYTSDNSDLKKYINSTAISNLLNNFTAGVLEILNTLYKVQLNKLSYEKKKDLMFIDFDMIDTHSYLKDEEVHYIYTINPKVDVKDAEVSKKNLTFGHLDLHLIYNTLTRAWRIYFVPKGNPNIIGNNPIIFQDRKSRDVYEFYSALGDMIFRNSGYLADNNYVCSGSITITKQTDKQQSDNIGVYKEHFIRYTPFDINKHLVKEYVPLSTLYDNYNYIDTGNVTLSDISLKRFRELQISIYSKEHKQIEFYGDFNTDGARKITATKYKSEIITDPEDPSYGSIFLYPIEVPNMFKWEDSTLAEENPTTELWKHAKEELGELWQLDLSAFPDLDTINMKIELKGKGRNGSFQLLNTSLQQYQLSNWLWVYRLMNARRN